MIPNFVLRWWWWSDYDVDAKVNRNDIEEKILFYKLKNEDYNNGAKTFKNFWRSIKEGKIRHLSANKFNELNYKNLLFGINQQIKLGLWWNVSANYESIYNNICVFVHWPFRSFVNLFILVLQILFMLPW